MKKANKKNQKSVAITSQDEKTRLNLVKQFIESVILSQYRQLVDWQTVTGQSSQLDSGYLAQQLVSLLTGIPGTGQRGKGPDLADGSEVKAASTLSGVDVPRWNNPIGELRKREEYLNRPSIFFVLFDTTNRGQNFPLRVRVWRVQPQKDDIFRQVFNEWAKSSSSGNFQLHPPCWRDDNIATNQAGNLELPLMFYAIQRRIGAIDYMEITHVNLSPGLCKLVKSR
ncbi:MamI family restriction endonuclease [Thermodesulfatator atlanticus]